MSDFDSIVTPTVRRSYLIPVRESRFRRIINSIPRFRNPFRRNRNVVRNVYEDEYNMRRQEILNDPNNHNRHSRLWRLRRDFEGRR